MPADATLEAYSPENCIAILNLRATSFHYNRTLEIYAGDDLLVRSSVPSSRFVEVATPVYLSKGANTMRLHVPEGCERPSDIKGLKNSDDRCLSLAVQNVTLSERKSDQLDYNQNNHNQSFEIYNLAFPGDFPTSRLLELPYIVKSKPKIVVFCPQYRWFSRPASSSSNDIDLDDTYFENRFALSANRILLDPYTTSFFNKKELDIIQMDFLHLIAYKRMLLIPSLQLTLSKIPHLSGVPLIKPFLEPKTPLLFGLGSTPNFKVDFIPPKIALNQTPPEIAKISEKPNNQKMPLFIWLMF